MAGKHRSLITLPHWAEMSKESAAMYDDQTASSEIFGRHRKEGEAN